MLETNGPFHNISSFAISERERAAKRQELDVGQHQPEHGQETAGFNGHDFTYTSE